MMKWSKYNYMYRSEKYGCFLYNSQTNAFLKLDDETYKFLHDSKDDIEICREKLSEEEFSVLSSAKIFVTEAEEHNIALQKKFLKYKNSFYSDSLDLVIATTTGCNFACPYCYETGITPVSMNSDVEKGIIEYVKKYDVKTLKYTWYGGEPLLQFSSIKNILDATLNLNKFNKVDNVVVTNGYLVNEDFVNYFRDKILSIVQITIDGLQPTHDKYRLHKSGISTYDTILNNIDLCLAELPDTLVIVRVNITNENKNDFPILWNQLNERWIGKKYSISPCYVDDHGECKVELCTNKDKAKFFIDLYKTYNIPVDFYPSYQLGGCTADGSNNFIIDPSGNLYKCWVDIGKKDKIIGSIFTPKLTNPTLFAKYMIECDMHTDSKCQDCFLFPICDGGCSYFRLEGKTNGTPYNVCPIDKEDLSLYLDNKYEQTINQKF